MDILKAELALECNKRKAAEKAIEEYMKINRRLFGEMRVSAESIMDYTEVLLWDVLSENHRENLKVIKQSASSLLNILDNCHAGSPESPVVSMSAVASDNEGVLS